MLTIEMARSLAEAFAIAQGEVLPNIYYGIGEGKVYKRCFYFEFLLVNKEGVIPEEPILAGGAPGVVVDKASGVLSIISRNGLFNLS